MQSRPQIIASPDSLNGALETWFIQNVIFPGLPYDVIFNEVHLQSDVIIYLELNEINKNLIHQIKSSGKKVVLYHMGDELFKRDISSYGACDLVIRNYYSSKIIGSQFDNVTWAPNGFRSGVGPRSLQSLKDSNDRHCFSSFLGWIGNPNAFNNERAEFMLASKECGHMLNIMPSNGFAGGCNVGLYAAIMEDSIFAPCPAGNSPETIRLYDALELGCIPISLSHDFLLSKDALGQVGPVPFPILNSWSELPNFLSRMSNPGNASQDEIRVLQKNCIRWWGDYKKYLEKKVLDKIQECD